MNILVACEESGIVRKAFAQAGHTATSIDLLPTSLECTHKNEKHIVGDLYEHLTMDTRPGEYDLLIAFPPCTHLCSSGARWFAQKQKDGRQAQAIDFFLFLANLEIDRIAIENPIGIMSTKWRKPDQIIQPWQFGHGETKATCLWLKNLPVLEPTDIVDGRENRIHKMPPSADRSKLRSKTYPGIAAAMAKQWGDL